MTPAAVLTVMQVVCAIALLIGGAAIWVRVTTRPAAQDPHVEPYGDIPQVPR